MLVFTDYFNRSMAKQFKRTYQGKPLRARAMNRRPHQRRAALEFLRRFCFFATIAREAGQDVVECGMMIAAIAIVAWQGVTTFGPEIRPWFDNWRRGSRPYAPEESYSQSCVGVS